MKELSTWLIHKLIHKLGGKTAQEYSNMRGMSYFSGQLRTAQSVKDQCDALYPRDWRDTVYKLLQVYIDNAKAGIKRYSDKERELNG